MCTESPYLFRLTVATSPFSAGLTGSWSGGGHAPFSSLALVAAGSRGPPGRVKGRDREATPQAPLTWPAGSG